MKQCVKKGGLAALAIVVTLLVNSLPALAVDEFNISQQDLMLKGYDPVAYFTEAAARQGSAAHAARHEGVTYHFATADNRRMFLDNPSRYVPAYGGYCSYGVRAGQKLDIDPTAWRVVEGRLFVQLDHGTRDLWMMDEKLNIQVADSNWIELRSEPLNP